ncbi:MAG: hypothetical protein AAGC78_10515 [Cellvibrio sp.]|uniref:hypothetical protein n=1 Tax=Cellvibrio sp. TaxID=1965322 RepID=UPI0031A7E5EB
MKKIALLLTLLPAIAFANTDLAPINKKVSALKARLAHANQMGLHCDEMLDARKVKGINSAECNDYLKIMNSTYLKDTFAKCPELITWYEAKRKFIFSNPNFASEQPEKADALIKTMKEVQDTCNSDTYYENFPYMIETLSKIRNMS